MHVFRWVYFFVGTLVLVAVCVKCEDNENLEESSLIGQLLKRVAALEERDAVQQKLIVDLQNELFNQKEDMGRMKQAITAQDRQIKSLLRFVRYKEVDESRKTSKMTERSVDGAASEEKEANEGRIRQTGYGVAVAFSAALSKSAYTLGTYQNIVFDHVFTNLGNGYNSYHGVFLAPVSGTYVFFMTIYAAQDHDIRCHFMVNGVHKSSVYAESMNSADDTSSQTIILQLNQGDDVAIQLFASSVMVYGSGSYYSTFSGFLLNHYSSQVGDIVG